MNSAPFRLAILSLCAWAAVSLAQAASNQANAFQVARVKAILADPRASYALVTRPSDATRLSVDLVELDPLTRKPVSRLPTPLSCNRLHASAAGRIFCFSRIPPGSDRLANAPAGYVLSRTFELQKSNDPRPGIVSRARMSADGRFTASTAFVTGHSYLSDPGQFSTSTFIGEADGNRAEQNLQPWRIVRGAVAFNPPDLNLWGVTFNPRDSNLFYVTASFDGRAHLAQGNVAKRTIEVGEIEAECPSYDPSGTRLAFKKKDGVARWVPAVLDLGTGKVKTFDKVPSSVDDQIEWLTDSTLIYEVSTTPLIGKPRTDLVTLDIRGTGNQQTVWLNDARSPTFVGTR